MTWLGDWWQRLTSAQSANDVESPDADDGDEPTKWDRLELPDELTSYGPPTAEVMYESHRQALEQRCYEKATLVRRALRGVARRDGASLTERHWYSRALLDAYHRVLTTDAAAAHSLLDQLRELAHGVTGEGPPQRHLRSALSHARQQACDRGDAAQVAAISSELAESRSAAQTPERQAPDRAHEWLGRAERCLRDGRIRSALSLWEDIVADFCHATDVELREVVVRALFLRATVLGERGHRVAEMRLYARLLEHCGGYDTPSLRHHAAMTLFNQGLRSNQAGDVQGALQSYTWLIERFRESTEPLVQVQVAMALVNRAGIFLVLHDPAAELTDYHELIGRYQGATMPELRQQVAVAYANKVNFLVRAKRVEDAAQTYVSLTGLFGSDADPLIRHAVTNATEVLEILLRSPQQSGPPN